jgi:hypothetical protein
VGRGEAAANGLRRAERTADSLQKTGKLSGGADGDLKKKKKRKERQ